MYLTFYDEWFSCIIPVFISYNTIQFHDIIKSPPPLSTCGHDKHYLRLLPLYISPYLHRGGPDHIYTISTQFCPATSCRTRGGHSHHSTLPRWHGSAHSHLSREREAGDEDQCVSAVSRVTCHVSRVMMLWPTDRCGTAASQVRQRRKYLSTEYLLGEDSCDIWSGSGAQNSVWDTRYEGLVGNTVDTHEIQISTIDNFIVIIIVISTFVDSWTPVKSFFDIHSVNIVALYIKYFWQM